MSRAVLAVGAVLVVALAFPGAVAHAAVSPPDAADYTVSATAPAQPADVQANETNETADAPPGVTNGTVTNASALLAAHNRSLAATGYRFTLHENVSFTFDGNESVLNESALNQSELNDSGLNESLNQSGVNRSAANASNLSEAAPDGSMAGAFGGSIGAVDSVASNTTERGTVAEGLAPSLVTSEGRVQLGDRSAAVRSETWANETLMLVRYRVANQVNVQRVDLAGNATPGFFDVTREHVNATLTKAHVVNLTLHTGDFAVTDANRSGNRTLYTLEATNFTGSDHLWLAPENVSEYDAAVVVDENGMVHALHLDLVAEDTVVRYDFEVTHVGPVEVERPAWTDAALGVGADDRSNRTAT